MVDEKVIETVHTETITAPESDTEFEVTQEWLESLFAGLNQSISAMASLLQSILQAQSEMLSRLESLTTRIPENLTAMISTQQQTIEGLVAQSMETVRALLTPPVQQAEIVEEPQSEEVVLEAPETAPVAEPAKPKRHRI
jgi:hypothetical protein